MILHKKTSPTKNFSRLPFVLPISNLVDLQRKSFYEFLQADMLPEKRRERGLQAVFKDVFPIANSDASLKLHFVNYSVSEPRCTEDEAIANGVSYTFTLKAKLRLEVNSPGWRKPEFRENDVFICDLPQMTSRGTFVLNGSERVIVSQLHRSPGVSFERDEEKGMSTFGNQLYQGRIIPYRGAWVELEFDQNNVLYVKIDRKHKFLFTILLRAIGYETDEKILTSFYKVKLVKTTDRSLLGCITAKDINIPGRKTAHTVEPLVHANVKLDEDLIKQLRNAKIKTVPVIEADPRDVIIHNTLLRDPLRKSRDLSEIRHRAVLDIFHNLHRLDYMDEKRAREFLDHLLFKSIRRYDLTRVGRYKINKKLGDTFKEMRLTLPPETKRTLTPEDILATVMYLNNLVNGTGGAVDDIDHLGSRRVRPVGELLENQLRQGFYHMARLTRDKMNMQVSDEVEPRDIINTAPVSGTVRQFLGTSQLSQFMDQVNPLASLTHERRLSAIGPGGLHRKRAGFEVRDVHYTHYGRICPIETPEGPNIGLICSMALYARVNEYGLLESPYRKVRNGRVTSEIEYLTGDQEDEYTIAQANAPVDSDGNFKSDLILCRRRGNFPLASPKEINYMDVSPKQLVGASAGLIPFLEHDDANRALMGSNMQRQAVPLLRPEPPLVGTGIEKEVAYDSGVMAISRNEGMVMEVTSNRIIIESGNSHHPDVYYLKKYQKSNQETCLNQHPLVKTGEHVKKGQVIADGSATQNGELALGRNVLVAFMSWEGYNFEDAIVVSERLLKEDMFSSVHIKEETVSARDVHIGMEEITADISGVGIEMLRNLTSDGVIRVGANVHPGDILVGKVAPKGKSRPTPEERLLRVIFGKKSEEVDNVSLYANPGVEGVVLDVKIFERHDRQSSHSKAQEAEQKRKLRAWIRKHKKQIDNQLKTRLQELDHLRRTKQITGEQCEREKKQERAVNEVNIRELDEKLQRGLKRLSVGDELPLNVHKLVKVYIASRRKLSVGDKLAGRHGNKGVVACILPVEDMPYLPDGTPVDVVLNPLGVPSRMNVGQIFETMLGWAADKQNCRMVSPVFDGATEDDVIRELEKAGLPKSGKTVLCDGRTGEPFQEQVTVGSMYVMKLMHMVEDKLHARSTGPYSLITRQPLGGKAQFGGQRFGEMEVWAVEGYGAASILQEFLTLKSDDIEGRERLLISLIKGSVPEKPGIPESFRVLLQELRALGLNVEIQKSKAKSWTEVGK